MKRVKLLGITLMIMGFIMIFWPDLIGSLIFGAIALIIAISSFINIYVGLLRKKIWVSPISIILLFLAVMVLIKPSLALKYAGYALILNSISRFALNIKTDKIFTNIILCLIGIFLILHHSVALNTITTIIGFAIAIIGALLYFNSSGIVVFNSNNFYTNKSRATKINIEQDEVEEVDYRDINE